MDSSQITHAFLTVSKTGQLFPLDENLITIGRKPDNNIVLANDLKTSRYHATISREADSFILHDVGSANGTYLNSQRITTPQAIHNGDTLEVGDTIFTVTLSTGDTKPSTTGDVAAMVSAAMTLTVDTTEIAFQEALAHDNPYVGPRTFTQQESNRFFGREREARELLSLVISERLTLFYAQSGAGKSSLINTRLVRQLREAGMAVLPTGRVSGNLPESVTDVDNIYIFNLLLSMDESDGPPGHFAHLSLSKFLTRLTSMDGLHYYYDEAQAIEQIDFIDDDFEPTPYVLIIDQFEEIITAHPDRWPDREDFFKQLDQAMTADPMLWVVLTLREDYVANLDPYIPLIPGKLRSRFYMQRMGYEAALEAIQKPADQYNRPFSAGAAENLIDNLRQIRVQDANTPGQVGTSLGQFVEPVQLQVVCYQLWENLRNRPAEEITQQDLQELGDVDTALAQFYEQTIAEVIAQTGVSEIEMRNWFERQLITEAGTRGTVYRGSEQTGGLDNEAVDLLVNKFLLRAEVRTGGTWYELVHDRLVDPIIQANYTWSLKQPLLQMAQDWVESGRSIKKLLEGQQIREAQATNWQGLGPLVKEFLTASQEAQIVRDRALQVEKEGQRQRELEQAHALVQEQKKRAEDQSQAAASLRRRAVLLMIAGVIAVVLSIVAIVSAIQAGQNALKANYAESTAVANEGEADIARSTAIWNEQLAIANASTASAEKATAEAASTAAIEQQSTADAARIEALAQQAEALAIKETAEAERNIAIEARATLAGNLESILTFLATATAEAEIPPTVTPAVYTPTPGLGPTPTTDRPGQMATPTATATPAPNSTITALEVQLLEVRATQTVVAQVVQMEQVAPTSTPELLCSTKPTGELSNVWDAFKSRLGCPVDREPVGGFFAEQPFENGYMFWAEEPDIFFVTIGNEKGEWELLISEDFNPNSAGCEPSIPAPQSKDLVQPVRGFGGIWCDLVDIQKEIGYGTQDEFGTKDDLMQEFENGYILRDSQQRIYLLFADSFAYTRENF
jgi:membrane protein involved in colicin uptake